MMTQTKRGIVAGNSSIEPHIPRNTKMMALSSPIYPKTQRRWLYLEGLTCEERFDTNP